MPNSNIWNCHQTSVTVERKAFGSAGRTEWTEKFFVRPEEVEAKNPANQWGVMPLHYIAAGEGHLSPHRGKYGDRCAIKT